MNGVRGMLYMQSTSTSDGSYTLTVTFNIGTDLNFAQVLVQNRVASATASLPTAVQAQGVVVQQKSTSILQIVTLTAPGTHYDSLFLSNYATINLVDELARIPGVGNVNVFGVGQYSMRVWLDPETLKARGLTPSDVIGAIQQQSQQVTGGQVGTPPTPAGQAFQYTVDVEGRLVDPAAFGDIVVKAAVGSGGQLTRVKDVARVELGAQTYSQSFRVNGEPAAGIAIFAGAGCQCAGGRQQRAGPDAGTGPRLPARPGLGHSVRHHALRQRLDRRGLQDADRGRRAGADRHPGVPAGLARHAGAGDDRAGDDHRCLRADGGDGLHREPVHAVRPGAVDRHHGGRRDRGGGRCGTSPRARALRTRRLVRAMQELFGPIIGITLVLMSVFVPAAFVPGLTGRMYAQFAIVIAATALLRRSTPRR